MSLKSGYVMQVSFEFPPYDVGGIGTHALALHRGLADTGVRVVTVSAPVRARERYAANEVWSDRGDCFRENRDLGPPREMTVAGASASLLRSADAVIGRFGPPALVHVQETKSYLAGYTVSRDCAVPLVATVHSTERRRRLGRELTAEEHRQEALRRTMLEQADVGICVSSTLKSDVVAYFGVREDKLAVVRNASVERAGSLQSVLADRRVRHAETTRRRIAYVGRLGEEKGVTALPAIVQELRARHPQCAFELLVVGEGRVRGALEREIAERGVGDLVTLLGKVPFREVAEIYATVDLLVVPSYYDTFPMVIVEAMSFGVPVLARAVGGIPELVTDRRTGWLVPADTPPEGWADHIAQVLRSPDRHEVVANAYRRATRELSRSRMAEETLKAYRRVARP